jgi:hypothetical protein
LNFYWEVREKTSFYLLHFAPVPERTGGEVQFGDRFGDDGRAELEGLGAEVVHQLGAEDSGGEAGEVFDCR